MAEPTPIRRAAGSLLVVGLAGPELTGLERAWLRVVRPGGIILFKRNIGDATQTRILLTEATGLAVPHALRCVDVEGGIVNRLRDPLAPLASAQAVAAAARSLRKPSLAREHGNLIGRAVRAFGFNTTLAPVLDLALPEAAEVMGSRTAGTTPQDVVAYAREFLAGLASQKIAGCGKHFPGLGGATGDTHLLTPSVARTFQQLWSEDIAPFRDLHRVLPMIMINHAAYPATPSGATPASASAFWISTVLRKRIGYRGLIFSDDLEMGGILKFMSIEESAVTAIRAGTDLVEICHSPELILRSYEALLAEAKRSAAFRKLLLERARTAAGKRKRLFAQSEARPLPQKQISALRQRILRFNNTIAAASGAQTAKNTTSPVELS
ncbi:MAG: beta-N-acetylhexosaminidase [Acidobacteriota bacterium]